MGVATHFSTYLHQWSRLRNGNIYLRGIAKDRKLTDDEKKGLIDKANERNKERDFLYVELNKLNLYFGDEINQRADQFKAWDTTHVDKTLDDLPSMAEWEKQERDILQLIRKELKP